MFVVLEWFVILCGLGCFNMFKMERFMFVVFRVGGIVGYLFYIDYD